MNHARCPDCNLTMTFLSFREEGGVYYRCPGCNSHYSCSEGRVQKTIQGSPDVQVSNSFLKVMQNR